MSVSATAGSQLAVALIARDVDGLPLLLPIRLHAFTGSVQGVSIMKVPLAALPATVEHVSGPIYDVRFTPSILGHYKLDVRLDGAHFCLENGSAAELVVLI